MIRAEFQTNIKSNIICQTIIQARKGFRTIILTNQQLSGSGVNIVSDQETSSSYMRSKVFNVRLVDNK